MAGLWWLGELGEPIVITALLPSMVTHCGFVTVLVREYVPGAISQMPGFADDENRAIHALS